MSPLQARILPLALVLSGCFETVREDRTITWAPDGERVAFQHGREGVYVAGGDGAGLSRIHGPDERTLATSAPLWSPDGSGVVFTTAEPEGPSAQPFLASALGLPPDPAGELFAATPVVYTCWLRRDGEPVALFRARCGHAGYVAGNLAVRWHPSGRGILFVERVSEKMHALREFDLARRTKGPALLHASDLVFDFAPGGELVCVTPECIRLPSGRGWWKLPCVPATPRRTGMTIFGAEVAAAPLEGLRASRPVWAPGGGKLAFVSATADGGGFELRVAEVATREVRVVAGGTEPISDPMWHPDGARLGYVQGGALRIGDGPAVAEGVRRFAGWSADGARLACVVGDDLPFAPAEFWSFLLPPDFEARDAVLVDGRRLLSGMRVTFPAWSPKDGRLSVWFTFAPTHRTPLSRLLGWGLQPGDPAAILLPDGEVSWMPVNAFEEAQIGHYRLLKRDAEGAWSRYERAAQGDGAPPRDLALFRSICLARLGRGDEARAEMERFRAEFRPLGGLGGGPEADPVGPGTLAGDLLRDLYIAEVHLALDDMEGAKAFFSAEEPDERERLAKSIVLGQLLLLEGRHAEYADLATATAPALFRAGEPNPWGQILLDIARSLHLMPLVVPDFLALLPDDAAEGLLPRWRALSDEGASEHAGNVVPALEARLGMREPAGLPAPGDIRALREILSSPSGPSLLGLMALPRSSR